MNKKAATATVEPKKKAELPTSIPFEDVSGASAVLLQSIHQNIPALLIGETGTGKTTCLRELAKEHGKELIRVSVNGATSVEEIIGKWLLKDQQTVWINGVLTDAMEKGHWIVFDEINAALPEILFTLHSVLDDDRKLLLAEKDGEIVRPHDEFRFFATMNPCITYAGTKEMNTALLSRFGVVIQMEHLSPPKEQKLIEDFGGVPEKTAALLTRAGEILRKAWRDEEISLFCSTRDLLQSARLINGGTKFDKAISVALVNKGVSVEERNNIRKFLEPVCKMEVEGKHVSYRMNEDVAKKLTEILTQLADEMRNRKTLQLHLDAEKKKSDIFMQQRDILAEIISKYIRPFLQSLAAHCRNMSEDKERTEESRKAWKTLADKIDERLKEIDNAEKKIGKLDEQGKAIGQQVLEGERILEEEWKKDKEKAAKEGQEFSTVDKRKVKDRETPAMELSAS